MVAVGTLSRQPGYFARILNETKFLTKLGYNIRILVLVEKQSYNEVSNFLKSNLEDFHFQLATFRPWRGLKSLKMIASILGAILSWRPDLVHAQAFPAEIHSFIACRITCTRNHYDVHGAMFFELFEAGLLESTSLKGRFLLWVDQFIIKKADSKTFVATTMADVYNPGLTPWGIAPCAVDTDRFTRSKLTREKIRKLYGWEGRIVFCFLGNMNDPWQRPDKVIEVYRRLAKTIETASLLIISPGFDPTGISLPDGTICLSLPPKDVPAYLSAADFGLLIRDSLITNKVASPTKFGEYLAMQLPVILSSGIGDISHLVDKHGLGLIYDSPDFTDIQLNRLITNRTKLGLLCREFAENRLSWESCSKEISRLYEV